MARSPVPVIGQLFGKLTAVREAGRSRDGTVAYECLCECGRSVVVSGTLLRTGKKTNCSCSFKKRGRKPENKKEITPKPKKRPAKKIDPLRQVWAGMMDRCYNEKSKAYQDYGGRGIKVSSEWHSFRQFEADMHPKPDGMTIERLDTMGGYCKANCVWATRTEQQNNRRSSIRFEFQGKLLTIREISEIVGLPYETLSGRLVVYKWSMEDAVNPIRNIQPKKLNKSLAVKLYSN